MPYFPHRARPDVPRRNVDAADLTADSGSSYYSDDGATESYSDSTRSPSVHPPARRHGHAQRRSLPMAWMGQLVQQFRPPDSFVPTVSEVTQDTTATEELARERARVLLTEFRDTRVRLTAAEKQVVELQRENARLREEQRELLEQGELAAISCAPTPGRQVPAPLGGQLAAEAAEAERVRLKLQRELDEAREKASQLSSQVDGLRKSNTSQQSELEVIREALAHEREGTEEATASAESRCTAMKQEVDAERAELQAERDRRRFVQDELASAQEEIQELRSRVAGQTGELREADLQSAMLREARERLQQELAASERREHEGKEELARAKARVGECTELANAARRERDESRALSSQVAADGHCRLEFAERRAQAAERRAEDLLKECDSLRDQVLAAARKESSGLEQVTKLRADAVEERAKAERLLHEREAALASEHAVVVSALQSGIERLTADLRSSQQEVHALQQQAWKVQTAAEAPKEGQREQVRMLRAELSEAQLRCKQLQSAAAVSRLHRDADDAGMKRQLRLAERTAEEQRQKAERLATELASLRRARRASSGRAGGADREEKLTSLHQRMRAMCSEHEGALDMIEQLRSDKDVAESRASEALQESSEVQIARQKAEGERDVMQGELREAKRELSSLLQEREELAAKLDAASRTGSADSAVSEEEKLKEQLAAAEDALSTLRDRCGDLESEREGLRTTITEVAEQGLKSQTAAARRVSEQSEAIAQERARSSALAQEHERLRQENEGLASRCQMLEATLGATQPQDITDVLTRVSQNEMGRLQAEVAELRVPSSKSIQQSVSQTLSEVTLARLRSGRNTSSPTGPCSPVSSPQRDPDALLRPPAVRRGSSAAASPRSGRRSSALTTTTAASGELERPVQCARTASRASAKAPSQRASRRSSAAGPP